MSHHIAVTGLPFGHVGTIELPAPKAGCSFETAVFGGLLAGHGELYPTREAALAGHDAWVAEALAAGEAFDGEAERYEAYRQHVRQYR